MSESWWCAGSRGAGGKAGREQLLFAELARFLCVKKYSSCGQLPAATTMSLTTELGRDAHNWLLGAGGSRVQHPHHWPGIGWVWARWQLQGTQFTVEPPDRKGTDRHVRLYCRWWSSGSLTYTSIHTSSLREHLSSVFWVLNSERSSPDPELAARLSWEESSALPMFPPN